MKLSEIKTIAESKMSEKHQALQDALIDEFDCSDEIAEQLALYMTDNMGEYEFEEKYPEAYQCMFDKVVDVHGVRASNETVSAYMEKHFSKYL